MRVYTLSIHNEDGAEELVATLDKTKLHQMCKDNYHNVKSEWSEETKKYISQNNKDELDKLTKVLEKDELGKYNISKGWGGIQVHIVELQ